MKSMEVSQQNLLIKITNKCELNMVEEDFYNSIENDLGIPSITLSKHDFVTRI